MVKWFNNNYLKIDKGSSTKIPKSPACRQAGFALRDDLKKCLKFQMPEMPENRKK
jgi:hypothetical protein